MNHNQKMDTRLKQTAINMKYIFAEIIMNLPISNNLTINSCQIIRQQFIPITKIQIKLTACDTIIKAQALTKKKY